MRKVFCIGLNKTGTTSLHDYFRAQGLSSLHSDRWPHWTRDPLDRWKFYRWTCYSDAQLANFANLEKWFPKAVFILNRRDVRLWLVSRIKHVFRPGADGEMATEFFSDPETAIGKWILERKLFHTCVRRHFEGRDNLLELDVTADPEWAAKLAKFLQSHGFNATGETPVHSNRRDEIPERGRKYLALVDDKLLKQVHA